MMRPRIHRISRAYFSALTDRFDFPRVSFKDFLCSAANDSLFKMYRIPRNFLPIGIRKAIPTPGEQMF
jgi:hypothetical protein